SQRQRVASVEQRISDYVGRGKDNEAVRVGRAELQQIVNDASSQLILASTDLKPLASYLRDELRVLLEAIDLSGSRPIQANGGVSLYVPNAEPERRWLYASSNSASETPRDSKSPIEVLL